MQIKENIIPISLFNSEPFQLKCVNPNTEHQNHSHKTVMAYTAIQVKFIFTIRKKAQLKMP